MAVSPWDPLRIRVMEDNAADALLIERELKAGNRSQALSSTPRS